MSEPKVSIIIPTFNRKDKLALALDSVISQTVRPHEIVIVDDGSTDGTQVMLREFSETHPAVRLIVIKQENMGPAAARNAGVKAATGDFVAFLDDDDVWHPEKTAHQLAIFSASPQIDLLGCASDILKLVNGLRLVHIGEWGMLFRNWFLTPTVIVRRNVVLKYGGFPEDMRQCEDYALWLRIASAHKCAYLNEVLVSCGHGKPPFGHSGLSADLDALYGGELDALARWSKERNPGMVMSALAEVLAKVRNLRRRIVAARSRSG